MNLSVFYSLLILFIFLSIASPTEFDTQCPTSRRLLSLWGFDLPCSGKKSHRSSSSTKSLPSSPPKYARSISSHDLTVFIRPQTSTELGHKARSYSHLLKSQLYSDEEKTRLKRVRLDQKKELKKKTSSQSARTRELIVINDDELNRCKALLHVDSTATTEKKTKESKKDQLSKGELPSKVKNLTRQATKSIKNEITAVLINSPTNDKKAKISKGNSKTNTGENKSAKLSPSSATQINPNRPYTSPVNHIPTKFSSSALPFPFSQSPSNRKSKQTKSKTITIIQQTTIPFDADAIDEKNNSAVGRANHFMKNMFQLSDDLLDENQAEELPIIDITNEQHHYHHHHYSRKLLSIDEDDATAVVINEAAVDLSLNNDRSTGICDDSSFVLSSISKRQLLSVKKKKHSTSSKPANPKEKKQKPSESTDGNKPKVGWAYRYRISRYLDAQKMPRTGNKNKPSGERKDKAKEKKTTLATKVSKRKILQYPNDDHSNWNEVSDHDLVQSVSITARFLPKRQLFTSQTKEESDEDDLEKRNTRRRKKSFEELTDPIAIVQSYDRGLHKPRVGWQFRYRVSRYIDALRENIREDQERLKLGLQAIKRKTPQELSGRRKRVLDKPFVPAADDQVKKKAERAIGGEDGKPNVGWGYRYRISKMAEAKRRGEYVDEEAEKRQARLEQKKKSSGMNKPLIKVNERIEGEEDLDPELRKINDEGRRVGWTYRYRIRRKLDYLKQQQAETGIPFDLATLGGKREKKGLESKVKATGKKTIEADEQKPQDETKSVGWKYRYRVSKMREAQKHDKSKALTSKNPDQKASRKKVEPEPTPEKSEERTAGWQYRYRIRRKLDSLADAATRQSDSGKRPKKSSASKGKEKLIQKVEDSIEQILNIDDIEETPFMEYFRRTSSYVLFGLLPTAKKSLCLLPLPVEFPFCDQEEEQQVSSTKKQRKETSLKKLKTRKEKRAKQFIRSHTTKFGAEDKATEKRVDATMKELYKKPSLPPPQIPPASPKSNKIQKKKHKRSSRRTREHESIKKKIGVKSKRNANKKQHQIIGQELKVKPKHASPPSVVTTPPPTVELPKTTAAPPLRSIAEVIRAEAATILAPRRKSSITPEENQAEINETNESIQEQKQFQTTTPTLVDSTTSGEEDNESSDNNSERNPRSAGENMHNMLNLEKEKN